MDNKKVIFEDSSDFKYYFGIYGAEETGLEFHLDSTYAENNLSKKDNYNIPVEHEKDELGVVDVPVMRVAVPDTYKKVIEVQEMNEAEINIVKKIRYILKLCFEGFFRGDNVRAWCAGIYSGFVTYDLIKENYVAAIILFGCSLLYTDVYTGFKTLNDYFTSKRREGLERYLKYYGVLDYTKATKSAEDVKMYAKFKERKLCQK